MEENTKEMIVIDSVDRYNEIFGLETRHPLVSIIDLAKSTTWPTRAWFRYEVYALYLKNVKCGDIKYGRQYYDYQDGTIVCFAPGQITDLEMLPNIQPNAHGILFHPDLIRGTALGQEIKKYSFFSYETNEALHISEEERQTVMDCLQKITIELEHSIDKHSRRLICANIGLLLDYCMRFYERQFITRNEANKTILCKMDTLLDEYIRSGQLKTKILPTVKYCANLLHLSPRYFMDLLKFETGKNLDEYFQLKRIEIAKRMLSANENTVSSVAEILGFSSVQYFSNLFRKLVGIAPNEYRLSQN